jgi:hypothetical protein
MRAFRATCCDLIKDAWQRPINFLRLQLPGPTHFRANNGEFAMTMISVVSMHSVPAARAGDYSSKAIALFCCVGLAVSLCLTAFGMDLGAAWV